MSRSVTMPTSRSFWPTSSAPASISAMARATSRMLSSGLATRGLRVILSQTFGLGRLLPGILRKSSFWRRLAGPQHLPTLGVVRRRRVLKRPEVTDLLRQCAHELRHLAAIQVPREGPEDRAGGLTQVHRAGATKLV